MKNSNTSGLIKHLQNTHSDLLKDRPFVTKPRLTKSKNSNTESAVNGSLDYQELRLKTEEYCPSVEGDKVSEQDFPPKNKLTACFVE